MPNLKLLAFIFLIFCSNLFADCGRNSDDTRYRNLSWYQAAIYNVNSPYANVFGKLCAGLLGDRIERVHYRDSQGTKVYVTRVELLENDITFFGANDFPRAARWLMKKEPALTLKFEREKQNPDGTYQYMISAKFLRNPRSGWSRADVREISLLHSTKYNETSYHLYPVDEIYLNINSTLSIKEVFLKNNGRRVKVLDPSKLPIGERK